MNVKKYIFYWVVFVVIWMSVCVACNKESEPEYNEQEPVITMTMNTELEYFYFLFFLFQKKMCIFARDKLNR